MEKVCPWCGQPLDQRWLRTEQCCLSYLHKRGYRDFKFDIIYGDHIKYKPVDNKPCVKGTKSASRDLSLHFWAPVATWEWVKLCTSNSEKWTQPGKCHPRKPRNSAIAEKPHDTAEILSVAAMHCCL